MKSGRIEQFAHLSQFSSVEEFNETIAIVMDMFGKKFTKGERIAFKVLTQFAVKEVGVCNARIAKLVQACQSVDGGISRSTFERMLRKAKNFGILSIYHTIREKGGFSHNVYVFHRFDGTSTEKLTEHELVENPVETKVEVAKSPEEANLNKTIFINKNHRLNTRDIQLNDLDETFVPSFIPKEFIRTVKPFFNRAVEICGLWQRASIAFREAKFSPAHLIEDYLPTIIQAFKETVFRYKQRKIKTSFRQYYYGVLRGMFTVEKRKMVAREMHWGWWLVGNVCKHKDGKVKVYFCDRSSCFCSPTL